MQFTYNLTLHLQPCTKKEVKETMPWLTPGVKTKSACDDGGANRHRRPSSTCG